MTNCFGRTECDYDVFGNLKKVVLPGSKVVDYKVDGYNRRIKKLVNGDVKEYYIWHDELRLAAILDHNKQVKIKFIYAPDSRVATLIEKNNTLYKVIHEPGLDSVRYVFNLQTKEVVQEIEYDELGNQLKNTNPNFQPLGYAGGLFDTDTKLIRFGARDYDPTVGRWTNKDPIGFSGGDTNLYAYVNGDPMSYVDPNGKLSAQAIGILAAAAAIYIFRDEIEDAIPCKDPERCTKMKTEKFLKEVLKNQPPKPGECPKNPPKKQDRYYLFKTRNQV